MKGALTALLLWALMANLPGAAVAQGVQHRVRKGETASSLSRSYYGTARHGRLIMLANGMAPRDKLWVGSEVLIPTARPHIVRRTTSMEKLAGKLLGHKQRWTAFKKLNRRAAKRRRVKKGQQVWVPYIFTHEVAKGEGWVAISSLYYGNRRGAKQLARYNQSEKRRPRTGHAVLVPVGNLHLTRSKLIHLINGRLLGMEPRFGKAAHRPALARARKLLRGGEYAAVSVEILRQISPLLSSARDRAEVFRLMGVAMVALERPALAMRCFAEMLRHQPDMKLDRVGTSPKVLEVVEEAAASARPR